MTFRCLWLARELPFPEDSGDRIHTARLARSLSQAGADVTFIGLAGDGRPGEVDDGVLWHGVGGGPRPTWRALLSPHPLQAALRATPAHARTVDALLKERWDGIVLDHYGSSWLMRHMRHARAGIGERPVIVHISHNHETTLWRGMVVRFEGPAWKRLGLWQNTLKIVRAEQRLAAGVDLLCCITAEDAKAYADMGIVTPSIVLTPGYAGSRIEERRISADTPRRVVLVGAYRWVVKQENVRALVREAGALLSQHGIVLDIVGDMPQSLRDELCASPSVRAHGFVDDLSPLLADARMALVPEVVGGGFKLKMLDYVFHRVPVVTLRDAAAGLPALLRDAMITCDGLPAMAQTIVRHIDDVELLDRLQDQAYAVAGNAYDWSDRGRTLLAAMRAHGGRGITVPGATSALAGHPHNSK